VAAEPDQPQHDRVRDPPFDPAFAEFGDWAPAARRSRYAAAMIARPVTTMVVLKMAAEGWRTTPSGGRVPPRSLMVFWSVR